MVSSSKLADMAVSVAPGLTAFTRIFNGAKERARAPTRPMIAAFEATKAGLLLPLPSCRLRFVEPELARTMAPPPVFAMPCAAARAMRKVPQTLIVLRSHMLPVFAAMDASHMDEAIEAAETFQGRVHRRLATRLVRYVDLGQQQLVESGFMRFAVIEGPQIGGADAQSLMQQMIHACAANAASRASDKNNPATRRHIHSPRRYKRALNSNFPSQPRRVA
jgi:hypothetical protein